MFGLFGGDTDAQKLDARKIAKTYLESKGLKVTEQTILNTGDPDPDTLERADPKDRGRIWRGAYEKGLTATQKAEKKGKYTCMCRSFEECNMAATLHLDPDCEFCHGVKSAYFPKGKMFRYYPTDDGWDPIRQICIELRAAAGEKPI